MQYYKNVAFTFYKLQPFVFIVNAYLWLSQVLSLVTERHALLGWDQVADLGIEKYLISMY